MRLLIQFQHSISALVLASLCFHASAAPAEVSVVDDGKRVVRLPQPAKRIVSLAPHVTELVFAAGAGKQLVGVSEYSDFPEEAKKIASIGSIFALDLERLLALKPDLVIIWGTGNAKLLAQKLRDNQLTVYENEPHSFEDIAASIEKIAILSGTETVGKENAKQFRQRLQKLTQDYQLRDKQAPIRVFHQMVKSPLMTVNKEHFISKMIQTCGGTNVFSDLKDISATITVEAMIAANPDFILSSGKDNSKIGTEWGQFPNLSAVKKKNLYAIPGDWLHRAGPRVLDATEMLCKQITEARTR